MTTKTHASVPTKEDIRKALLDDFNARYGDDGVTDERPHISFHSDTQQGRTEEERELFVQVASWVLGVCLIGATGYWLYQLFEWVQE